MGVQGCDQFFPPGLFDNGRVGRGNLAIGWELLSGKFGLMARMLANLRQETNDRIVIVSNYTQTLDLFSTLCRERQVNGHPAAAFLANIMLLELRTRSRPWASPFPAA